MINSRTHRTQALIVALVALAPDFAADTYITPPDFAVACLDVETGELLWETRPSVLDRPTITVAGDVVIAESEHVIPPGAEAVAKWPSESFPPEAYGGFFRRKRQKVFFATDGEILKGEPEPVADVIGPLEVLPRNLTAADGTVFAFDPGNTRHLEELDGNGTRVVRELAGFPHDLNVAGDLAIFSLAGNIGHVRGGEVVAYDLRQGALRWQFESWRHVGPPLYTLTDIAVDDDRVLVAVDQVIFALDLDSGAPIEASGTT